MVFQTEYIETWSKVLHKLQIYRVSLFRFLESQKAIFWTASLGQDIPRFKD